MSRIAVKVSFRVICRITVSVVFLMALVYPAMLRSQSRTVGLFLNSSYVSEGYVLFAPFRHTETYLIDNEGRLIHSWASDFTPGSSAYLLENGNLLRGANWKTNPKFSGGAGGRVEEFDWEGNLVWSFEYSGNTFQAHHDFEKLPNGNVLMIAWEVKPGDEAIASGRDPALLPTGELWPDHIIEVRPSLPDGGEIVWKWHAWDHLIQDFDPTKSNYGNVSEHPELLDLNYVHPDYAGQSDWLHLNAIDYNADLDQIIVSSPFLGEIWIIDHSTTLDEARSHAGGKGGKGGDLLYRWGNPRAYGQGAGEDKQLFFQHDAQWIEPGLRGAGNILIFNNGADRPDASYSSIYEIESPVRQDGSYEMAPNNPFGPEQSVWSYTAEHETEFYSPFISGAQRLPGGNTLICSGMNGTFFEVTEPGETVWKYVNPVVDTGPLAWNDSIPPVSGFGTNLVFRANRYGPLFPGFAGKELIPGQPIEIGFPTGITAISNGVPAEFSLEQNYPNPFNGETVIEFRVTRPTAVHLAVHDMLGREVAVLLNGRSLEAGTHIVEFEAGARINSGVYVYCLTTSEGIRVRKMLHLK